jgi:hypothetical protein
MKRRIFLQTSVAGSVFAFSGASLLAARPAIARPPEGLQELFADEAQIRQLGALYLSAHPDESGIGVLRDLTASAEDPSLAAAAISHDFEHGNVVTVDGWILSRTEARHCALFSLLTTDTS